MQMTPMFLMHSKKKRCYKLMREIVLETMAPWTQRAQPTITTMCRWLTVNQFPNLAASGWARWENLCIFISTWASIRQSNAVKLFLTYKIRSPFTASSRCALWLQACLPMALALHSPCHRRRVLLSSRRLAAESVWIYGISCWQFWWPLSYSSRFAATATHACTAQRALLSTLEAI